jgi:RNA polymerase primary sigma factor
LDDREKFIVQARYGFDDLGEKPTFQRLGELLGISKERVRQLEQRALAKLRQMAEQMHLEMAF